MPTREQSAEEYIWFQPFGAQSITGGYSGNSIYKLQDLSLSWKSLSNENAKE